MKLGMIAMIGILFCMNLAPSAMQVNTYCEEGDECIRSESGMFKEDYLFVGHELRFSGQAEDLVFLGKRLSFDGTTTLGMIAGCEKLIYSGMSGNGIIAGGMEVLIEGKITGNSYIGCHSFTLTEKGKIDGNLFVGCAKLAIDGTVNGDLYVGAGKVVINNEIKGNVTAYGGRIIIGEKGKINGNLKYYAKEKMSDESLARVTGTVVFDQKHGFDKDGIFPAKFKKSMGFLICLALFISFVVVGCLLLFLPAFRKLDHQKSGKIFWNTALWGLIPVLMYPAIILFCFVLVITIPFAFVLMLAFVPLFYIANIIGTTLLGKYLVTKFKWSVEKRHYHFLIGALVGALIALIPFVNFLWFLFVSSVGWGVYISFLFKKDLEVAE